MIYTNNSKQADENLKLKQDELIIKIIFSKIDVKSKK
jgi:hypothetical protein